jgi:hypothetical protein
MKPKAALQGDFSLVDQMRVSATLRHCSTWNIATSTYKIPAISNKAILGMFHVEHKKHCRIRLYRFVKSKKP